MYFFMDNKLVRVTHVKKSFSSLNPWTCTPVIIVHYVDQTNGQQNQVQVPFGRTHFEFFRALAELQENNEEFEDPDSFPRDLESL